MQKGFSWVYLPGCNSGSVLISRGGTPRTCVCERAVMGERSITWQDLLKKPPQAKEISPVISILKKNSLLPDLLKCRCVHRVCGSV